ncbi:hypothetical protein L596_016751 [Steinernema carpocapsae]|uniref:Uncharacterized protein n=1 Tax=Steinernema carpocapsae TaxID=34508 RepID=A0A4V6A3G8_STECR|nr:hypothetical protein L596_016751 [Steinernema carpocapsae]
MLRFPNACTLSPSCSVNPFSRPCPTTLLPVWMRRTTQHCQDTKSTERKKTSTLLICSTAKWYLSFRDCRVQPVAVETVVATSKSAFSFRKY